MQPMSKKVLRVVFGVFIYLFVGLFIYLIYYYLREIHSPFSKRSDVDLHVTG